MLGECGSWHTLYVHSTCSVFLLEIQWDYISQLLLQLSLRSCDGVLASGMWTVLMCTSPLPTRLLDWDWSINRLIDLSAYLSVLQWRCQSPELHPAMLSHTVEATCLGGHPEPLWIWLEWEISICCVQPLRLWSCFFVGALPGLSELIQLSVICKNAA